jgi:DNA repair exonuclease SbcCD ATPase subunit
MDKAKNAGGRKTVVLSGRAKGKAVVLTKPEVQAGREGENAICLKGRRVSLKQEVERLEGEAKLANEALESMRADLQTQSEQRADLAERLGAVAQEKTALAKWNDELRARVSELEVAAGKADRVEVELAVAQAALRQLSEDLAKARESAKRDVAAGPAEQALPLNRVRSAPVEVRGESGAIGERIAPAVLAKRDVSDPTNEQFDRIRRTIVEKKNLKANMSLLDRFMLPFRDTAHLVQEQDSTSPE